MSAGKARTGVGRSFLLPCDYPCLTPIRLIEYVQVDAEIGRASQLKQAPCSPSASARAQCELHIKRCCDSPKQILSSSPNELGLEDPAQIR
jgi:hypothetical protein